MSSYFSVNYDKNDPYHIKHIGYKDIPVNASWGPGSRNECIIHYILSGSGYVNDKPIKPGQGFYFPPNRIYKCTYNESDPWHYMWIIFSEELGKKYIEPLLDLNEDNIFTYDFKNAIPKFYFEKTDGKAMLTHLEGLSIFFSLISMHQQPKDSFSGLQINNIQRAKNYIKNNLSQKITVKQVADSINVNDRYLYNLFVKYENITPKEYMDKEKITSTKKLLELTDLSISEIARAMGCDDVCNFSRFFSKHVGISPTQYRILNRK